MGTPKNSLSETPEVKKSTDKKKNTVLFFHTKHKMLIVSETIQITRQKTAPFSVSYQKDGVHVLDNINSSPADTEQETFTRQHMEDAPRLSFAGVIQQKVEANPDMVEVHVGVSMTKGHNKFDRKKGRKISLQRALNCPILIIYCLESEALGVFHKAVERLTPVVISTKETMCGTPHEEHMSLNEILAEETAD